MTDEAHRRYHEILHQWRDQGRRIGWEMLQEAYRLARQETAERTTDQHVSP